MTADDTGTGGSADPTDADEPTVALVTVSYGPDRERCELLCRSLDALATGPVDHWLIVERADARRFAHLESPKRSLLITEDVVPGRLLRVPTRRFGLRSDVFVTSRGKPVRGWLLQQLAKLAICRELDCDVVVHADSDVTLVKPFRPSAIVDDEGRVRLYRIPGQIDSGLPGHVQWHRTAEELLGLPPAATPLPEFITHLVSWKRANAVALLDYLDDRHGAWVRVVANAWNVSEYILYGRFVSDVLDDVGGHYVAETSLCHSYWGAEPLEPREIDSFIDAMHPEQIAVSLTAKAGIPAGSYEGVVENRWRALQPEHRAHDETLDPETSRDVETDR